MNQETVRLVNVAKVYSSAGGDYTAVKNVNFTAEKGKMTLILGPSGSGKTTLLTMMAGLTPPSEGEVFLFGRNMIDYSAKEIQRLRLEKIGFVFQTFLLIDALTVYENLSIINRFSLNGNSFNRKNILSVMDKTGITHLEKKRPFEISHGERQRTAIARALLKSSELLLADEPTASIENEQGEHIIQLLKNCASGSGTAVIIVSHDTRLKSEADSCFRISGGILAEENIQKVQ